MAAASLDDYLREVSPDARARIDLIRSTVHELAPDTVESISYGMPTFRVPGRHRFYAAAWAKHVGVYPVPRTDGPLEEELAPLRAAKDTVQLRYAAPLDEGLVRRLVTFLLERTA